MNPGVLETLYETVEADTNRERHCQSRNEAEVAETYR